MEPYSTMAMVGIGLGLQAFGMSQTSDAAKEANAAEVAQIELQQKVEAQRQQQMRLQAKRQRIENVRMMQGRRAAALANATAQGAAQGSGLQGGFAQIAGQGAWNALGLSQNLEIGENIFGLNAQISEQKIREANARMEMQEGSAWSNLGQSFISSAGTFGQLASGFGNKSKPT